MGNRMKFLSIMFAGLFFSLSLAGQHQDVIAVRADQPIAPVQSTMWGIFFEDINFAADGGLYAELVKNRSFEFARPLMGWKILKKDISEGLLILNRGEANAVNPRFARITRKDSDEKFGLENEGFRGMGIKKGMTYHFSILSRNPGNESVHLRLELVTPAGVVIGSAQLSADNSDWKNAAVDMVATATEPKAKLVIWFEGKGTFDLDMISLFPGDTWKNRPGGLRNDLVQLLADMRPGFVRFPGGCIVEGFELATRYQWKKTVGPIEGRQTMINRWNTEFKHKQTPDYYQSFGLGFFEYFQLAEDLGAEPLPILSCGMACQYNSAEVAPMDQLDPYIQDALDLIEFANGSPSTFWGGVRVKMGHPEPFNLKMLGIGNEQWGAQYIERYEVFAKKIKQKYPLILLVSGTGPSPNGKFFEYASRELKRAGAEIVDEHYYANPEWFMKNASRYDKYDRGSYKIFAGEYAAQSVSGANPENRNTWRCALSEAAFMTGLERNADVVSLCSYAPLFAHTEGWQWTPDLIWFDNLNSFGSASYYVQKMFSTNRGTHILPVTLNGQPLTGQNGLYASAVVDRSSREIILKVVNANNQPVSQKVFLDCKPGLKTKAIQTVLRSSDPEAFNTLVQPLLISPAKEEITVKGKTVEVVLAPFSFSVIKFKMAG